MFSAPPIIKPKPPSATSIPATLKTMQDEWDALMLHTYTLRQQLQTARQELSHALYQHDAACRTIARLNKEVTAAREALNTLKPQAGIVTPTGIQQPSIAVEANGAAAQPAEQAGMTQEVIQKLQDKATVLTQERKKRGRTVPEDLITQEQIRGFMLLSSHPVSYGNILCKASIQKYLSHFSHGPGFALSQCTRHIGVGYQQFGSKQDSNRWQR